MLAPNLASQLSPKQREALDALLSGATVTDAAATADIHRSTLHNWCRENTAFRAALRDARSQQAALVQDGLRALAGAALDTIATLLKDPATPAAIRFRAATHVIQNIAKSDPYTQPAEPQVTTAAIDGLMEASFRVGAEERTIRDAVAAAPAPPPSEVPRSAPCPCGSGEKFKRCCGRNAPGLVGQARAA